jgi:DNA-directed RNA polymerase subunit RPC12/RpoP
MTEPLSTVCDHCGAKLKLKNPDLEGKKIKCPKCSEAFVVVAAGDETAKAKKPVKKKSSEDDDDLGFMDLDTDDYGPPPDEDEDGDDASSPRLRSSRGGKKKSKKKSKKGGDSSQIVKVLVIIIAAVVLLGGGGYAMISLTKGGGSADVDWLPSDIQGFVKIQVDNIWSAGVFQTFKNSASGKSLVDEMTRDVGFGPEDVDLVVIGIPAGMKGDGTVTVVRAKKAFDLTTLQKSSPGYTLVSGGASSYLKGSGNKIVYPADSKTMLFGPEEMVKAVIERGKKNPNASKFSFGSGYRDHIVVAIIEPTNSAGSPLSFTGTGQGTQTALVRANASSDIRMTAQTTFATSDAAKGVVDKMKADLDRTKTQMTQAKAQMQNLPANPMSKLASGAEQVMNSIQVSQSGSRVNVNLTVSGQLVNDFTEVAGSMGGPPRLPLPFGR